MFMAVIDIDVHQTKDATIAFVSVNGQHVGSGTAKRHPNDKHNPEIGHKLAVERAIQDAISNLS